MPKVLHAFKDYYPPTAGGVERHINDIVHRTPGFEFAVLTSSRSRRMIVEDDQGVDVFRTPELFRPVSTPITPHWLKFLRGRSFDLMHFHMPNPFGELARVASGSDTPFLASYHAEIIGRRAILPFFTPVLQSFLGSAQKIVVGSPRFLDTAEALKPHRDKTVVIPYGTRVDQWESRPKLSDAIRERFRPPIVLFLGRLAYYKGLEVLIDAMRNVDATCLIAGEGHRKEALEKRCRELGIDARVKFCGEVPEGDRAAYYHAADVFVLPSTSRAESFGIAMLEAMACGTPAVSTELGTGTSWLNQDGLTGRVVAPGDPAALAGALQELLKDESRRQEFGQAATDRVREGFDLRPMTEALEAVYRSVISSPI